MSTNGDSGPRGPLRRLLARGTDPDPRFTLANERTFLAWIRTALALMAGGIGLEAFVGGGPGGLRRALAAALLLLGGVLAVGAFVRWVAVERAMREHGRLPLPAMVPVLSGILGLAAVALLVLVLSRG